MTTAARTMPSSSTTGRLNPSRDNWTLKPGARYPPTTKPQHRYLPNPKSQWKYSKAQLKAHMMLPEPLPIPKSVLFDYKKNSRPNYHHRNLAGRSTSTESSSGSSSISSDSGADDLSDTSSEHSEWDSVFFLGAEAGSRSIDSYCKVSPTTTNRLLYPDVIPLALSPAIDLNQCGPDISSVSRPLSPAGSTSSNSTTTLTSEASSCNGFRLDLALKSSPLGQLHFQCARCFIIYPSVDLIEKHIGQFHMRPAEGESFQLSEDNFSTLVKAVWDADLSYGLYTGYVRHYPAEPATMAHLEWCRPTFPAIGDCHFDEYGLEMQQIKTLQQLSCGGRGPVSVSEADSGMETDGSESCGDELSSSRHGDDILMRSLAVSGESHVSGKKSQASRLVFSGKSGSGVTRKMLADTMKKINRIIAAPGVSYKRPVDSGECADQLQRLVPKKPKMQRNGGEKSSKLVKKGLRKCRGVYGIDHQDKWCNMCKWKKRCSRFSLEKD